MSLPFCFFSFLVSVPLHTTAFPPSLSCSVPLPFSLYPSVLSSVTLPLCPIPKCFSIPHRSLLLPITNFFLKLSSLPSVPFFLLLAFFPTSSTSAFLYFCVPLHSLITLPFLHPFFFQSICCVPCPPSMPIFLCPSVILLFSLSLSFCLSLFCPSPSPGHASCLFPCLSLPLSQHFSFVELCPAAPVLLFLTISLCFAPCPYFSSSYPSAMFPLPIFAVFLSLSDSLSHSVLLYPPGLSFLSVSFLLSFLSFLLQYFNSLDFFSLPCPSFPPPPSAVLCSLSCSLTIPVLFPVSPP